ncbi:tyrosine-protein phosphatase [Paenibacillus terrigena]|uniref:tyrosine-protein phosphatase n=1 Tax=Paenibacillus terrigena TaxID=369333 RepID=UPI0003754E6E|nr:CpsB/CapC family capsule biosynthesis tyrosine phosphatase [Paenibacillus terrigena]
MIDIHSHILPGIDDGSQSIEESIAMAKAAVAEGIKTIIATPHHANGRYDNEANDVQRRVLQLNQRLAIEDIPLKVLPGQEIRVYNQLIRDLEQRKVRTLDESSYMLIEFPTSKIPNDFSNLLHELRVLGITAIIAHPERNAEILKDLNVLEELIEQGALAQMTSHSLNGLFGAKIKDISLEMCERNLVHFIASDAHNLTKRGFELARAYETVSKQLGADYTIYYQDNAQAILEARDIQIWEPVQKQKKWYAFWK